MSSLSEIIRKRKYKEQARQKVMSKEKLEEQVTDWCDFYRRNWDIYAEEELEMSLKEFQKYVIHEAGDSDRFFFMCGRGLSKSWMAALIAFIHCMLYPNARVVITATTKDTAKRMFEEKMEGELCSEKFSKKLHYLYERGYIQFSYPEDKATVEFKFNGSTIQLLPELPASAGKRATMLIFEEVRLSKQSIINRIFRPMRYARQADFRVNNPKSEYFDNPKYVEKAREVYLTSTSYNFEWWFQKWKNIVEGYFAMFQKSKKGLKYKFFAGDIITSIYHGFTTQEEFDDVLNDQTMSPDEIKMEYYNEPLGSVEGSFYNMESIKELSTIEHGFTPPSYEDFLIKYHKNIYELFPRKVDGEVRALAVDYASSDSLKGSGENDNTVIWCMRGVPNKDRTKIIRNYDYITTFSGGQRDETLLAIRELFYFYDADVFIYDNQQTGSDRFQDLTRPFHHPILNIDMKGFGILPDIDMLKNFCDEARAINLMSKVVDSNARPVSIPVVGSSERNQNFHFAMQSAIADKKTYFLQDSKEVKSKIRENPKSIMMSSEELAERLKPHIQTDAFAVEASELQREIKGGYISLHEINHHPKDRIVSAIYGNYYFAQLEIRMLQGNQEDDYNESDWDFLSGDYSEIDVSQMY